MLLLNDVIVQARQLVQDVRGPQFRHSDEKLVGYFNTAIADAFRLRPDLFMDSPGSTWDDPPVFTASDMSAQFPLDRRFFSPLVEYVAGMLDMENDEFANDGRAVALLNRFGQKLLGKGA